MSEEETWGKLNNGKFAAAATTTDVLAVLGRQFDVTVPVQIGFSRGADMIVVDHDLLTMPEAEIMSTHVDMTFVGGKLVYHR